MTKTCSICCVCKQKVHADRIDCIDEFDREVYYHLKCYENQMNKAVPSPALNVRKRSNINFENIKKVKRLREKGLTIREIAAQMDISRTSVSNLIHWRQSAYKKKLGKIKHKIITLYSAGFTYKEITDMTGVARSTAHRYVTEDKTI